jgi:hypothetical protein
MNLHYFQTRATVGVLALAAAVLPLDPTCVSLDRGVAKKSAKKGEAED